MNAFILLVFQVTGVTGAFAHSLQRWPAWQSPGGAFVVPAVHADAESPTEPGLKSVLTDSLDDCCDPASFYDELLAMLREPVGPREAVVLKEVELKEHGSDVFTVKVILDGAKLHRLGFGEEGGPDLVKLWMRVEGDRSKEEVHLVLYNRSDQSVYRTSTMKLLRDPFRVELWRNTPNGTRLHGRALAQLFKNDYLAPIATLQTKRQVLVHFDVESPSGQGKSAISDPLDRYITYGGLFHGMLGLIRSLGRVKELSPSAFEVSSPPRWGRGTFEEGTMVQAVQHDMSRGSFNVTEYFNGQIVHNCLFRILRDPLRIETWNEATDGKRDGGRRVGFIMQEFLNSLILQKGLAAR
mmetsp:Transcript_36329/g.82106  ORF Transcript_36329/g.82106 Transcript_36329/m.82106 type:complete len:353 (-) Transcript_36329:60-1118(-)|eukprot:CAMPEP_0197882346 /NCGR_PEP_ID=MMETSP1439-20131203/9526_1 /TAXON_ID=66791 /ORGANISM="Gonyaulax spinifera, Strain CCMP409" /LENGTH=352 /DNA_ID=CAMNT_0043502001 /DNA_START=135 /DNA_END=1193 /DNA_ORIENTATION=-